MIERLSAQTQSRFFLFFFDGFEQYNVKSCEFLIWVFENKETVPNSDFLQVEDFLMKPFSQLQIPSKINRTINTLNLHYVYSMANQQNKNCPVFSENQLDFFKWFYTWNMASDSKSARQSISNYENSSAMFLNPILEINSIWELLIVEHAENLNYDINNLTQPELHLVLLHILTHYSSIKYPLNNFQLRQLLDGEQSQSSFSMACKKYCIDIENISLNPGLLKCQ